jgi:hypothetical protein
MNEVTKIELEAVVNMVRLVMYLVENPHVGVTQDHMDMFNEYIQAVEDTDADS